MPVLDGGSLAGILTETDVLTALVDGRANPETSVAEVMVRQVSTVSMHAGSGELPRIFERGEVAIVMDDDGKVAAIVTKLDLIEHLAHRRSGQIPVPPD